MGRLYPRTAFSFRIFKNWWHESVTQRRGSKMEFTRQSWDPRGGTALDHQGLKLLSRLLCPLEVVSLGISAPQLAQQCDGLRCDMDMLLGTRDRKICFSILGWFPGSARAKHHKMVAVILSTYVCKDPVVRSPWLCTRALVLVSLASTWAPSHLLPGAQKVLPTSSHPPVEPLSDGSCHLLRSVSLSPGSVMSSAL